MLIQDLERNTGLDRAAIRFYEKEGLLNPQRSENGYRQYSQEDQDTLLKIKLLRQLGLSLEKIRAVQQGNGSLSDALSAQLVLLQNKIHDTQRAEAVCEELCGAKVSYESLNAVFYLEQLNRPYRERVPREYHPWRRFFARMLDYWIPGVLLEFVLVVVLRIRPIEDIFSNLIAYGTPFLMVPVNALLLSRFGTTLGKWLFALRVESENGGNLTFEDAVNREWTVLKQGMGFGIPIWNCWWMYQSRKIYEIQDMEWDDLCEYRYGSWDKRRKQILAAVLAAYIGLNVLIISDLSKPKYRGDLTIAEFAANYNFYYGITDNNITRSERLQSDGTWYPESDGTVTIYMAAEPLIPDQTFFYEMENGILTSIRYENSWTDIFMMNMLPPQCSNAAITVLMSQKGSGLRDLYAFGDMMDSMDFTENGQLTYGNLNLQWSVDNVNCTAVDHRTLVCTEDGLESSVSLVFEIIILPD